MTDRVTDTVRDVLAALLDQHWLESEVDGNPAVAGCSGDDWRFVANDRTLSVTEMGQHFYPFSEHIADAIIASLAVQGYRIAPGVLTNVRDEDGLYAAGLRLPHGITDPGEPTHD